MSARLSVIFHALIMSVGVGLIYWWLHSPLTSYSLQAFAVITLSYFVIKAIGRGKAWHFLPAFMSIETVLATMAFLLLIGATGNTASWFYPLAYIHLFFVVFSSHVSNSIFTTILIMLFHYGLSPDLAKHEVVSLLSLPVIMAFFIFARLQHEEMLKDKFIIQEDKDKLSSLESEEFKVENFLQNFLDPKLIQLQKLLNYPENLSAIKSQLHLIRIEIAKLLSQIK